MTKLWLSNDSMDFADVTKQFGDYIDSGENGGFDVETADGKLVLTINWRIIFHEVDLLAEILRSSDIFAGIIGLTSGSKQC